MPDQGALRAAFGSRGINYRDDAVTRALYATDASPYRITPVGVARPRDVDGVHAAMEAAREAGAVMCARGGGTSLSGQSVTEGVQIDLGSLTGIEWIDPERKLVRVQPGVTWWQLNLALREHGLEFGPDPATKRQCTIGGMICSNAGGTHSIVAGATVDHVHALDVVLADGTRTRLTGSSDGSLASTGLPAGIAADLEGVRARTTPLLDGPFHGLARRGSGYQLEHLCTDQPHAGKLIAGSDGTLGFITAAELTVDTLPASRVLAIVGFDDMHAALAVAPAIVATWPSAVELISRSLLDVARADRVHAPALADLDPDVGALLLVEYSGESTGEATAGFGRLAQAVRDAGGARWRETYVDPEAIAARWAIREAGVGALASVAGGPQLPQAFVEDTTVAVDRLPGYIREFDRLFERHQMRAVWYGHASTGLIHVRPFMDLTQQTDLDRLESLMRESVDLVKAWGGDLCGEHGNGLSRTYWNERLFGADIYQSLREIKGAFDPDNVLNPGKVVEGPHPLTSMRYAPGHTRRSLPTPISFEDQGGFAAATERCFGAGVCRKQTAGGTMCPPAMATGLEEHSTRARANLLRSVVDGTLPMASLSDDRAREVMETCVSCKACATECPARVDMARLKAVWSDRVRREHGATPMQRAISNLRRLAKLGSRAPRAANAVLRSNLAKKVLGVAPGRALPPLADAPLTRDLGWGGDVMIYPDCFTTYFEPEVGRATASLVRATGREPGLAPAGCCGRTMLSEGFADHALDAARAAAGALRKTTGPIVVCEPSCRSMIVDDWPNLIGDVGDIVARVDSVEGFVAEHGRDLTLRPGGRALVHPHCHEKALGLHGSIAQALALVPDLDVEVLDAGCCGMAGAFGYREKHQELSRAMGERVLAPAVRGADASTTVVGTGTSCRHQIGDLAAREAVHPAVFLADRLDG